MINAECQCVVPATIPTLEGRAVYRGANTVVRTGGVSVVAIYGGVLGGRITNPLSVMDQGIFAIVDTQEVPVVRHIGPLATYGLGNGVALATGRNETYQILEPAYGPAEPLFVSLVGPADLAEGPTTIALQPGDVFDLPDGCATDVWVNAATSGHRFSAIIIQPRTQLPVPYAGAFPPSASTTKSKTIPSYLYKEYQDDDNLQSLVDAFNQVGQSYVDWFNALFLPVFPRLSGALLDWVGEGLYGVRRPTLYSDKRRVYGAFGQLPFCKVAYGTLKTIDDVTNVAATSDDVYKRIIAWHVYKGDGKYVTQAWLKRRIVRFLYGANGLDSKGSTDQISILIAGGELSITIVTGTRRVVDGAFYGRAGFGRTGFGATKTIVENVAPAPALATIFQEAVLTGALEMPEQYTVTCRIGILGIQ